MFSVPFCTKRISVVVRDTISESLSDFLQKSQTPVEALWSLRSIDHRVIALHSSFVKLHMPQNASLILLISEPIRVNVFSFVIYKRGNSQHPEQVDLVFVLFDLGLKSVDSSQSTRQARQCGKLNQWSIQIGSQHPIHHIAILRRSFTKDNNHCIIYFAHESKLSLYYTTILLQ